MRSRMCKNILGQQMFFVFAANAENADDMRVCGSHAWQSGPSAAQPHANPQHPQARQQRAVQPGPQRNRCAPVLHWRVT
jgi:hypothetical protein